MPVYLLEYCIRIPKDMNEQSSSSCSMSTRITTPKSLGSTDRGPRDDSLVRIPVLNQSTLSSDLFILVLQIASRRRHHVPYSPISHLTCPEGWALAAGEPHRLAMDF